MKNADIIVKNTCIVTMDKDRRILNNAAIVVIKDEIAAIGNSETILAEWTSEKIIDATDKVLFPGFINTHSHLFQVLLKGLGRDKTLFEWLDCSVRKAIWKITPDKLQAAVTVGCIENFRSGTTTVLDYQYCHGHEGCDEAAIAGFKNTGIRAILGRGHTKNCNFLEECMPPFKDTEDFFLSEVERFAKEMQNEPKLDVALAPGIIWDMSEEGYKRIARLAKELNLLVTMHLNETEDDDSYSNEAFKMDTIPFLEKVGILAPNFIAVHCVNMQADDIATFKKYDVKISHNPVSNMILASGVAPVPEFQQAGLTISLATDGAASNDTQDMMETLKITALIHKCVRRKADIVTASEVLEFATLGGAKAIGREKDLGSLEIGKKADFFIFNPKTARAVPMADPIATIVYSATEQNIETTIIGGEIVLEDGIVTKLDEAKALKELQEKAAILRKETGLNNIEWGQVVEVEAFKN